MRRSVGFAAAAMDGRLSGARGGAPDGSAHWQGATLDSRQVRGGELFFALPGEHTDGHRFAGKALAAGAAAAVVHRDVPMPEAVPAAAPLIRVADTLDALHALVRRLRAEGAPPQVLGITGSVGKTTTKELLAAMLARRHRGRHRVAKNEGNLNNLYGYPLTVLRTPDDAEWLVAEMGMSFAGELARLTELARPDAVVYTCVRPVHLENFDSVRGIAEAKAELLEGLAPGGLVVANADDPEVVRFAVRHAALRRDEPSRIVWYGRGGVGAPVPGGTGTVEVSVEDLLPASGGAGSRFTLTADGERVLAHLPLHGDYNVSNALAAAAAAWALGVPLDGVAAAMGEVRPGAGRGIVHRRGDTVIVDDTYNSNPDALERALEAAVGLARSHGPRRRWTVLGDMLELGPDAPAYHREAGRRAAELGFSPVAGVGELARELAAAAAGAGAEAPWFAAAAAAAEWAVAELAEGDLVLVKGSRGVGLDLVVERLLTAREDG